MAPMARLLLLVFVLMSLAASSAPAQFPPSGFTVGEPFPQVTLPAVDGGAPLSVSDFRGRKLILHVFASW